MIPLAIPHMTGREADYLLQCVSSNQVSSVGPFVERFEGALAKALDAREVVATSSGTAALHLALRAVGVLPGDLVLMPALTFVATANAVAYCQAEPWLHDVARDSWTLDPRQVRDSLERCARRDGGALRDRSSGKRIACILPVYTLGLPADMDALVAVADAYDLPVVADAAAAIGARYRGRPLGQLGAAATVLSFNGNKTLTCGGGGAVVSNTCGVAERARHLGTTARIGPAYDHDEVGYNYRMINLSAAVGCAQLEAVDSLVARKHEIARAYSRALSPPADPFPEPAWAESACWLSGILLRESAGAPSRVREALRERGIDARPFWKPLHLQAPYRGVPREDLRYTEKIWDRILPLPCSAGLSACEQDRVIAAVREVLAHEDACA